jgi:sugar phosphate isomerase/epimerase
MPSGCYEQAAQRALKTPEFSLEPLTFAGLPALEMVRIAAATGFRHVSLLLNPPIPAVQVDSIVTDASARSETLRTMRAAGIGLQDIECFNLTPEAVVEDFRAALECGHELGARTGLAVVWENSNRADAVRKYQHLCDMAAEYSIRINVEFLSISRSMRSLQDALQFVSDAQRSNAGVLVDLLHLIRTGGSVGALRRVDPALVGMVQLCDAPAIVPEEFILEEASAERLLPGEGDLPVREFIEAVSTQTVMGLEVPKRSVMSRTSALEHAGAMIAAARAAYAG